MCLATSARMSWKCAMAAEKSGKHRRLVGAAEEVGARVAEDAVHVADEFVRRADLGCGAEVGEFGRGVAEGFLCSVGEGGEEVF